MTLATTAVMMMIMMMMTLMIPTIHVMLMLMMMMLMMMNVGSRRRMLVHDFTDKLLLCPPTSLLTIFTLLSLVVIQPFCVLQSKS